MQRLRGRHLLLLLAVLPAMQAPVAAEAAATAGAVPHSEPAVRAAPIGTDARVSGAAALGDEFSPAVARDDAGNAYLVVWRDGRNLGARGYDIYGRLLRADGTPETRDFRISGPGATDDEWDPAVSWNAAAGEYLVVWGDDRALATRGVDVYGRRVRSDGVLLGGDFRVNAATSPSQQSLPSVAWNRTTNQYLVVWEDWRNVSTRSFDIYGRLLAADGTGVGGDFRISGAAAISEDQTPAVVWNRTANQFLVVWSDRRGGPSRGFDVYGRRLLADATPVAGDFRISGPAATSDDVLPALAWNRTANEYLVVWQDGRDLASSFDDIYGRRLRADGTAVAGDFRISSAAGTGSEESPAVAWNRTNNQYLVVWADGRSLGTRLQDIFGRIVTAAGLPLAADFRISGPAATSSDFWPDVTWSSAANEYLVVRSDRRDYAARGYDVYGRRVSG